MPTLPSYHDTIVWHEPVVQGSPFPPSDWQPAVDASACMTSQEVLLQAAKKAKVQKEQEEGASGIPAAAGGGWGGGICCYGSRAGIGKLFAVGQRGKSRKHAAGQPSNGRPPSRSAAMAARAYPYSSRLMLTRRSRRCPKHLTDTLPSIPRPPFAACSCARL